MELSDDLLVGRAKARDPDAFRQLVERHRRKVYGIAWGMTGNHGDADDIAQETFVKAYRRLGEFEGQSGFYTWLYRIATNCSLDLLRRKGRRAERDLEGVLDAAERPLPLRRGTPPDARREAAAGELREAVRRGVSELPGKHRAALVLHDIEGMPHDEIARMLGCSPGTVRSRLHYARLAMQRKLRKFVE